MAALVVGVAMVGVGAWLVNRDGGLPYYEAPVPLPPVIVGQPNSPTVGTVAPTEGATAGMSLTPEATAAPGVPTARQTVVGNPIEQAQSETPLAPSEAPGSGDPSMPTTDPAPPTDTAAPTSAVPSDPPVSTVPEPSTDPAPSSAEPTNMPPPVTSEPAGNDGPPSMPPPTTSGPEAQQASNEFTAAMPQGA